MNSASRGESRFGCKITENPARTTNLASLSAQGRPGARARTTLAVVVQRDLMGLFPGIPRVGDVLQYRDLDGKDPRGRREAVEATREAGRS